MKLADEKVISSTVLQNDDELFFPVDEINCLYTFEITFYVTNAASARGFKWKIDYPAGCIGTTTEWDSVDTLFEMVPVASTWASTAGGNNWYFILKGIIKTSTTTGNVTFQWAQSSAGANNTIVKAGSYLTYTKVNF
jgi:hypothetical protein